MAVLERGPSLTDQAAEEIRARIVRGVFQLGEPLSEIALANELGVSKTPVREALMELKRQGLVEVHPQRGTFVFDMNATQVEQLSEQRAILETAALALALGKDRAALGRRWREIVEAMRQALTEDDAERYRTLDGDFHRTMFELADNPFLLEAFDLIAFRVQALRNRLSRDPDLNSTSFQEHIRLAEMVEGGAAAPIDATLRGHIEWTREHYLAALAAVGPEASAAPPRAKGRRRPSD
ncbi:GntR family transcriptional regulator [Prosthecomicrobium pneumaticum]|uniref:DNA-binding GntR family transcriptional regulator n=1 Tax=Prosthecomicrobium pneumaticum TaxID=81895 RepID=A0A7W9FQS8_9HYPH|nr:GntR family transcriptional regulator [Prosthecomicrobium pneumaticum]MBB5755088.1 DNA-binding GntR family transcriptional regulator [Prosthecomicrobium pneumaticum]